MSVKLVDTNIRDGTFPFYFLSSFLDLLPLLLASSLTFLSLLFFCIFSVLTIDLYFELEVDQREVEEQAAHHEKSRIQELYSWLIHNWRHD